MHEQVAQTLMTSTTVEVSSPSSYTHDHIHSLLWPSDKGGNRLYMCWFGMLIYEEEFSQRAQLWAVQHLIHFFGRKSGQR